MEQIFREQYPDGSHTVYAKYSQKGDLTLSSHHFGGDVESFWGNDEFEFYLTIPKDEMPKFVVELLAKGFNTAEKFGVHPLKEMCEAKGIKYSTYSYV